MKKYFFSLLLLLLVQITFSQKKWVRNFGIEGGTDGMFGLAGVSLLTKADNPLINSDLDRKYAVAAGFYAEFLQLKKRADTKWGAMEPGFGIKTKLDWQFFRADNSKNGGSESLGLNYFNVPVLFEYCLGYHEGVTRASVTPENTTISEYDHTDYTHIIATTTPSHYNPGGAATSSATFIYAGPQICYLFKSFNYSGASIKDQNLKNNYVGLVGGVTFCLHQLNFDFSYQKGMTSIYNGKNIMIDGFLCRVGINFGRRLYNKS